MLVNGDGSFLSTYHLREHPAARDRVRAGNTWIERAWIAVGSPARESTFAAGRDPMMRRAQRAMVEGPACASEPLARDSTPLKAAGEVSLRRMHAGRRKPLLHVDGGFSLSRSAEKPLALDAGRGAFRLFSQPLRLIGQALIQWRGLFYAASFLHGATPKRRRGRLAVPSPIAATGWCGDDRA